MNISETDLHVIHLPAGPILGWMKPLGKRLPLTS
jgi:hypothetical protein